MSKSITGLNLRSMTRTVPKLQHIEQIPIWPPSPILCFIFSHLYPTMSFCMSRPIIGLNLKSVARTVLELERIELCCQGCASPLTFKGHRRSKVKVALD